MEVAMQYKLIKLKSGWVWAIKRNKKIIANSLPVKYSRKDAAKRGLESFLGAVNQEVSTMGTIQLLKGV